MSGPNQTALAFPPGHAEETTGYKITIPCAVFMVLCPIVVGIRVWARISKVGKLQSEDWVLLLALVCHLQPPSAPRCK